MKLEYVICPKCRRTAYYQIGREQGMLRGRCLYCTYTGVWNQREREEESLSKFKGESKIFSLKEAKELIQKAI